MLSNPLANLCSILPSTSIKPGYIIRVFFMSDFIYSVMDSLYYNFGLKEYLNLLTLTKNVYYKKDIMIMEV